MKPGDVAKFVGASVLAGFSICSAVALSEPGIAGAATNSVTNCLNAGPGSLRAAVGAATSGATITFSVSCPSKRAIKLKKTIDIDQDLTVDGPGAGSVAVSGSNKSRVFQIDSEATVSLSGLTIEDGAATTEGGGIRNVGNVTLTDVVLSNNAVTTGPGGGAFGGGLANEATATVTDSTVTNNRATSTGYGAGAAGIYNDDGTLTVSGTLITDNVADATRHGDALGGGISNGNGNVSVSTSTLSDNKAKGTYGTYGGGIDDGSYGIGNGTLTISDSAISGNSATGTYYGPESGGGADGGGLSNYGAVSITDSTLADNTATTNGTFGVGGSGGALVNFGTMTVVAATIAGNAANDGSASAASIASGGTSLTVVASIVALGSGTECYQAGAPIADAGYNIDDDGSCGFSSANNSQPGVNPELGPLRNNGGPTETLNPHADSPALNQIPIGTNVNGITLCPSTDQRAVSRPQLAACDIGSVERKPSH